MVEAAPPLECMFPRHPAGELGARLKQGDPILVTVHEQERQGEFRRMGYGPFTGILDRQIQADRGAIVHQRVIETSLDHSFVMTEVRSGQTGRSGQRGVKVLERLDQQQIERPRLIGQAELGAGRDDAGERGLVPESVVQYQVPAHAVPVQESRFTGMARGDLAQDEADIIHHRLIGGKVTPFSFGAAVSPQIESGDRISPEIEGLRDVLVSPAVLAKAVDDEDPAFHPPGGKPAAKMEPASIGSGEKGTLTWHRLTDLSRTSSNPSYSRSSSSSTSSSSTPTPKTSLTPKPVNNFSAAFK